MKLALASRQSLALRIENRARLVMTTLPAFPAAVIGADGISVEKSGATFTFRLQPNDFGVVTTIAPADQPLTYFLAHHVVTGVLQRIAFNDLATSAAEAQLVPLGQARLAGHEAMIGSVRARILRAEAALVTSRAAAMLAEASRASVRQSRHVVATANHTATGAAAHVATLARRLSRKASGDQIAFTAQVFG